MAAMRRPPLCLARAAFQMGHEDLAYFFNHSPQFQTRIGREPSFSSTNNDEGQTARNANLR